MGECGRDLIALLAAEPDLSQRLGEMVGEVAARAKDLAELAKGETVLAQRAALGAGEAEGSDTRRDALLESGGLGWRNGDGRFHGKKSTGAPRCPRNARLCAAAFPPEEEASTLGIREQLPPRRRPCHVSCHKDVPHVGELETLLRVLLDHDDRLPLLTLQTRKDLEHHFDVARLEPDGRLFDEQYLRIHHQSTRDLEEP